MYNTILVPLDGSKRAEAILPHVEELAQRCDAKVIFLHVVEPFPFIAGPGAAIMALHQQGLERLTGQAESYLAALLRRVPRERYRGPDTRRLRSRRARDH